MNNTIIRLQKEVYGVDAIHKTLKKEVIEKNVIITEKEEFVDLIFTTKIPDIERQSLKNMILATMVEEGMIP